MTNDDKARLRELIKDVFQIGFSRGWHHSGEGFNSEYGCSQKQYKDMLNMDSDDFMVWTDKIISEAFDE